MSTTPHRFPPWSVPRLGEMTRSGDIQSLQRAMVELEQFLYSIGYGQVQGMNAGASPTLAEGDMIYHHGLGDDRLPIGDEGEVLTVVDGDPAWEPLPDLLGGITLGVRGASVYDPDLVRILELIYLRLRELDEQLTEGQEDLARVVAEAATTIPPAGILVFGKL